MSSGGGPGLQSREGGNRITSGGFDSHPFRLLIAKTFNCSIMQKDIYFIVINHFLSEVL